MGNKPIPRKYSQEQISTYLTLIAMCGGSCQRAAGALNADGVDLSREQLKSIKKTYADEYTQVLTKVAPKLEEGAAEAALRIASDYQATEEKLLAKLDEKADKLDPKDVAGALRNVAVSKAVNIDKHQQLTGQTVAPSDTRNVEEMLKSIAHQFKGVVKITQTVEIDTDKPAAIDSTAVEVDDGN